MVEASMFLFWLINLRRNPLYMACKYLQVLMFFFDVDGFPETIRCYFDPRLIGGKATALLRTHGTCVWTAPPHRQDKNGLVERRWQSLTKMARSFLTEAKLSKNFWFWVIREANLRLNILPITQQQGGTNNFALMSTTHFEFWCQARLSDFISFWLYWCFPSSQGWQLHLW